MTIDARTHSRSLALRACMRLQVSFDVPAKLASFQWENSKPPLMKCSLLCLSKDHFATCLWALAAHNTPGTFAEGRMHIQVQESGAATPATSLAHFPPDDVYVVMEPSSAYFGAYLYAMRCLQKPQLAASSFMKYFVHLQKKVDPPAYLARRAGGSLYSFGDTFPELRMRGVQAAAAGAAGRGGGGGHGDPGGAVLDIMHTPWPEWDDCALDDSQKRALQHALSREMALIQGPPGTGCTRSLLSCQNKNSVGLACFC